MKLTTVESKLIGHWIYENGSVTKDNNAITIEELIKSHLQKIATAASGWDVLYIDPDDNRLWEVTYLQSDMQGGGPPSLFIISKEDAKIKYLLKTD